MSDSNKQYKKVIKVNCRKCHKWLNEKDVEFVDIEEDIQGIDTLTFICPICNIVQKSRRF